MQPLDAPNGSVVVGTLDNPREPILSGVEFVLLAVGAHVFEAQQVPCEALHVSYSVIVKPSDAVASTCAVDVRVGNRLESTDQSTQLPVSRALTGPSALANLAVPGVETGAHVVIDATSKFAQLVLTITGAPMFVKVFAAAQ